MEYSNTQKLIILAYNKGYRIINNECINPKGKTINGCIKTHPVPYKQFSIKTPTGARSITYHALLAYQLYGEEYFKPGIVARHLDGNSLNNHETNIVLGTQKDNRFDTPAKTRSDAIRKSNITSKKLYQPETINSILLDYKSGMGAKQLYKKYDTCLNTMYILIRRFKAFGMI